MTARAVTLLALLAAVAGCGDSSASWGWLEAARGHLEDPVDLPAAERLAQEAVATEVPAGAALGNFILGNVAFARSAFTERAATQPGSDPNLLQRAMADAEDALAYWRMAASSRTDWPAARRNVERGILLLERLRQRASDRTKPKKIRPRPSDQPPPPPPRPDKEPTPDPSQDPAAIDLRKGDLPAGKVLGLLDLLREKERKKLEIRRVQRHSRASEVERDW